MRCIGFDEHFADNGVQDCGCCGALEVVAKGMVGGVDLVWRINDWMEIVFFAEALEGKSIICDGIFECVCHGDGIETGDGCDKEGVLVSKDSVADMMLLDGMALGFDDGERSF